MKSNWFVSAVKKITAMIYSYEYKCDARQRPEFFSRESGKIGFTNLIAITLNFLSKSMQTELDRFFEFVIKKTERVSKQAFFEPRYKLKETAFRMLFDSTAEMIAQTTELKTFNGYRVLATDGTILMLEDTYSLRGYFGECNGCAAARASVMSDVLNCGLVLDARIDKMSCSERELALLHYERLKDLQMEQRPVLLFDRGYASADMFEKLHDTAFLFRLQRSFNTNIDRTTPGDRVMDITIKKRVFRLRVLKFKLSTGEIETLVTNLPKESFSSDDLKVLYNMRWGVETAYRVIKSALQIENFTGSSQLFVKQDFFATMFLKNMVAFAKLDANEVIAANENPDNKYRQIVNENLLIGLLKDKLILALLEQNPRVQARKVNAILKDAVRHTVPIRPDRHFPRIRRHSKRFHLSGKSSL